MPQHGFYFDKQRCVGCRACEVACQVWNGSNQTVKWRGVTSILRGKYPAIASVNVSLACMHCGDAVCVKVCPRQALAKEEESGIVVVTPEKCMGCMLCLWACPFGAPQLGTKGKMEKCNFCEERPLGIKRACEEICPTQAIVSGPIEELGKIVKRSIAEGLLDLEREGIILGHE